MQIRDMFTLEDQQYMVDIRRRIHRRPELGFDLPETVTLVKQELEKLGVSYSEAYGKGSIVATLGSGKRTLKELADEFGAQNEYRALFKEAQLGRQYRKELEDGVVRLCLALDLGAQTNTYRNLVKTAAAEDLMQLKTALEARLAESLPVVTQLGGSVDAGEAVESGFLI